MDDGYKLLIELFESHAMKHFKDHVTQNYFSSKTNESSIGIKDLLQIEFKDDILNKLKEDLTIELQNKFNKDTNAELTRLREEFEAGRERLREELKDEKTRFKEQLEARFDQTFQDLKSKAGEFEAKNNELGLLLDENKAENNDLKKQINEHKLENEGLI